MKKIAIIGYLGADARLISEANNVFAFSVAVNESYTNREGIEISNVLWFDCTTNSPSLAKYLKKGRQVYVEGNPRINLYQTKAGEAAASIQVAAQTIRLLSGERNTDEQAAPKETKAVVMAETDDLPF